jgi:hypothetical protein
MCRQGPKAHARHVLYLAICLSRDLPSLAVSLCNRRLMALPDPQLRRDAEADMRRKKSIEPLP